MQIVLERAYQDIFFVKIQQEAIRYPLLIIDFRFYLEQASQETKVRLYLF